jgi:very-short-patch-repair endonuclease
VRAWTGFATYNWPLEPVDNAFSRGRCVVRSRDGVSMKTWPFIGTEAIARGDLTPRTLRSGCDRIYRNVYTPKGVVLTPADKAVAAWLWSGRQATVAGLSAAALHGAQWIDIKKPAELYRRNGKPVPGILIHRDKLLDDERKAIRGMSTTTAARTAFDLGRRRGRTMAVVYVDALANATGLMPDDVHPLIGRHPGVRGLRQLREVLELMDGGAESPQETRTRLVLVDSGLQKPETQIPVGRWRIDMGYREFKVGVEYDGEQHWTDPRRRAHDIDRHAELSALGWIIVRVSADMLRYRRHVIVERTCEALRNAGAEWPVIARILGDQAA